MGTLGFDNVNPLKEDSDILRMMELMANGVEDVFKAGHVVEDRVEAKDGVEDVFKAGHVVEDRVEAKDGVEDVVEDRVEDEDIIEMVDEGLQ
ncbi:hypothetical protein V6N13_029864 [Hibiscus sabdariffa]